MQIDLMELENLLITAAREHAELADLLDEQRQSMRKADLPALEKLGPRLESLIERIATTETQRRGLCHRIGLRMGLSQNSAAGVRLAEIAGSAAPPMSTRLLAARARLADAIERIRRTGQANALLAGKLSEFYGQVFEQVSRVGRQTGCYDARGRKALARVPVSVGCLSMVG